MTATFARRELRPALELWFTFLAVWLGLFAISTSDFRPFGYELAQTELRELWAKPAAPPLPPSRRGPVDAPILAATATADPAPAPTPAAEAQRILMLGDSMLDGLLPRLADYAQENGHSLNAVIWYGSRTIDWARGSRLSDALRDFRPTYVIVVVGSSELTTRDIEKRTSAVQQILKHIEPRSLIWVGPPNWRADTGIGAILEREVGAQRYFRSLDLTFERKRDGIHPTLAASQKWMDAIATFITTKSAAPLRLAPPQKSGAPRPVARVFPPPSP